MKAKLVGLMAVIVLALAMPLAAQTATPVDPAVVKTILNLTFVFGGTFTIVGLTEMLKRLIWKNEDTRPKWAGYFCSAVVSIVATVAYTFIVAHWPAGTVAVYALFVWLAANGFYKAL